MSPGEHHLALAIGEAHLEVARLANLLAERERQLDALNTAHNTLYAVLTDRQKRQLGIAVDESVETS